MKGTVVLFDTAGVLLAAALAWEFGWPILGFLVAGTIIAFTESFVLRRKIPRLPDEV